LLKEQSEATSTIRQSSIIIRHSMKFHMNAAAGLKSGQFNRERNLEKANIEYRIMNVEYRRDVFCLLKKRLSAAKPSFDILRFAVQPGRRLPEPPV
jgi:hypothetical protein